ncbi:hypothetical protein T11_9163 [Trichinella zimbabwensis]|uniref:Uncharacterized protein n=1 Tax=Trichinella zimbabwensis TaxID=268475 RepID=A0A0V1H3R6_9BILA|nr:hypothetical protein T11_9163 [Trichinella zimbabwensis]
MQIDICRAVQLRQKDNENKKQVRHDHQPKTKPRIYRPRLVWAEEDHGRDSTSPQAMAAQRPQRKRNPPLTHHKGMDGKKLLIPFKYNLESTIHDSSSPGCLQSNVRTRSKYQYMPRCTLPQQKIFTGLRCPECVRDLQIPTIFRQFRVSLYPVVVDQG